MSRRKIRKAFVAQDDGAAGRCRSDRNPRGPTPPWVRFLLVPLFAAILVHSPTARQARAHQKADRIDPRLVAAKLQRENIERLEAVLDHIQVELINTTNDTAQLENLRKKGFDAADAASLSALRTMTQELLASSKAVLLNFEEYKKTAKDLANVLAPTPSIFRTANRVWVGYAEEEKRDGYEELAADYMTVASLWEAAAKIAEQRIAATPKDKEELEAIIKWMKRSRIFLERFDKQLLVGIPLLGEGKEAAYVATLKSFLSGYDRLREKLKETNTKFREKALNTSLKKSPKGQEEKPLKKGKPKAAPAGKAVPVHYKTTSRQLPPPPPVVIPTFGQQAPATVRKGLEYAARGRVNQATRSPFPDKGTSTAFRPRRTPPGFSSPPSQKSRLDCLSPLRDRSGWWRRRHAGAPSNGC